MTSVAGVAGVVEAPAQVGTRRLAALDAARGLTVVFMILVENQGDGAHAFPGMAHARWHGFTFADLVFPGFLFVMGASMALSLRPDRPGVHGRVVRRAVLLFGLGLLLNLIPHFDVGHVRVMGVLQRIGIAYLVASLLVLHAPLRKQVRVALVALVAYWAMLLLPVPGHEAASLSPEVNVAGAVDREVLGAAHVYKGGGYDPEGLLSTIPAVVTVLAGFWAASWLRRQSVTSGTTRQMAVSATLLVVLGVAWGQVLPVNKRLWTSSFVVLTAGLSLLLLAACYEVFEVRGRRRLAWWPAVFGVSALVVYVASGQVRNALTALGWRRWLYDHVFSHAGLHVGSLLYGVAFVGLWWAVAWMLWRRRVFVKI